MGDLINNFFAEDSETSTTHNENDDIIIGIDLGTCNSCCSIWRNGYSEIITDEYGNRTIPSVVSFTNMDVYIGYDAKNQMLYDVKNTFYEFKRLMGKKITDTTIIGDKKFLTYELQNDEHGNVNAVRRKGDDKILITPEELSSYILIKLKKMASEYLKCQIKKAVISVPAYFNDAQRQATRDAATIAGLECVRIISEPIASALAYGLNKLTKLSKNGDTHIVVYDLGGGTLDISLLTINDGVFEVIGSAGNTHLGGVDFDNRMYDYCINMFKTEHSDFVFDKLPPESSQKLHKACENAKKVLSTSAQTTICVTNFYDGKNFVLNMTRNKFNDICNDLMIMCLKPLDDILDGCDIGKEDISEIILVGGMTRVPAIRENIHRFFGKCPNSSINPDETVAVGASIQGYIIANRSDPFSDSVTLLDTTPLSLGVETIGGVMNIMIPRGTLIPTSEKRIFSNDTPNETSINIKIYEGERKLTRDNFCVGEFDLCGIEPAVRGYHKIEVTFIIDIDGLITVSAVDLRGNNTNMLRINGNRGRLTTEAIEKMVANAKIFEANDKINKKKKKMHYELTELCDNIIKNLDSSETSMPENEKDNIRSDISKVGEMLKKQYDEIDEKTYRDEMQRLNRNYCILVTKNDNGDGVIKNCDAQTTEGGTSIFQTDDIDDEKTYVKISATEFGYDETIDTNKLNEIKQIRDTLINECHSVLEIIDCPSVIIDEENRKYLKDLTEDMLVWVHVQQKITIDDYKLKLNELTETCNKMVSDCAPNTNNNLFNKLMTLCQSLKSSLESNPLDLDNNNIIALNHDIDDIMKWMEQNQNADDAQYQEKIDMLNCKCNEIYNTIIKN